MKKNAFTLVELLVVISIIAILSVIGITIFSSAQKTARDAKRRGDLHAIYLALEQYHTVNASYPRTGSGAGIWSEGNCTSPASGWTVQPNYTGSTAYIPDLAPTYISSLPGDPNVNGIPARCYIYWSDGTDYLIAAHQGAESAYQTSDPMIRLLGGSSCTTTQPTFIIRTLGRCW